MGAKIEKIEYYLPEKILSNEKMEEIFTDWSAEKIESKVGIRNRHISGESETALDMGYHAANKVLNDYNKDDIDFVLFCTQSPDYFLPTSACILQDRLGLRRNIGALDFNLGCSGYIYGLCLAKGIIESGSAKNILLVVSETYSKYIAKDDKANMSIFGDGAAATIISKSENNGIMNFSLGTDGRGRNNLIVENGGARNPIDKLEKNSKPEIYMDGPEIFNFTIENVPIVVNDTLSKNNLLIDGIDYTIFHQANSYILNYLRKKVKIPKDKFYINMLETGNTVSASIPIALKDCLDSKKVKKGDKLLLVGFGVGYSWGGIVVEL